jgi:hypothetical protein
MQLRIKNINKYFKAANLIFGKEIIKLSYLLCSADSLGNKFAELLKGDCLCVVSSDCVDHVPKLLIIEAVFKLLVNISEFIDA